MSDLPASNRRTEAHRVHMRAYMREVRAAQRAARRGVPRGERRAAPDTAAVEGACIFCGLLCAPADFCDYCAAEIAS